MLFCLECRCFANHVHDHRDGRGLDDGPEFLTPKSAGVAARRRTAKRLRDAGLKQETIADLLRVSRPTIVADLSCLESQDDG